jgi:hypothetical protein
MAGRPLLVCPLEKIQDGEHDDLAGARVEAGNDRFSHFLGVGVSSWLSLRHVEDISLLVEIVTAALS